MVNVNVHAGHNPDGMVACGAVGYLSESTCARAIKDFLIVALKSGGYRCNDCTCNNGISQQDVLNKIINKCNSTAAECDISIHLNSFSNETANGTECYIKTGDLRLKKLGELICKNLNGLGYKNRGVKESGKLAFLNRTKNPAILIEVCFVTNKADADKFNAKTIADSIAAALFECYGQAQNESVNKEPEKDRLEWYTTKAFVEELQELLGLKVTGVADSNLLSKTITISKNKNNKNTLVWAIQKRLTHLGYDVGEIDGVAGIQFDKALCAFQKDNGCVVDGEATAGKKTWKKLMEMG